MNLRARLKSKHLSQLVQPVRDAILAGGQPNDPLDGSLFRGLATPCVSFGVESGTRVARFTDQGVPFR